MIRIIRISVYVIYTSFLLCFICASLFLRAQYNFTVYKDIPVITRQNTVSLIAAGVILFLVLSVIVLASGKLEKYSAWVVVPIILTFSILIQSTFILMFPTMPTADMGIVDFAANKFLEGSFEAFERGHYLYMHPQNMGISLYLYFLYSTLSNGIFVPKFMNILFSTLTSLMIFLIYRELNGSDRKNDYSILIAACLFPPSIVINNLIYNDIISTSFFTCSVFFAIKYVKCKKIYFALLFSVFLSLGNFLRSIGLIFLLAIAIYVIFNTQSLKKTVLALLIALMVFSIPSPAVKKIIESRANLQEPIGKNSAPVWMWIHMGMSMDTMGFWDDWVSYDIYFASGWDKKLSEKIYRERIAENLKNLGAKSLMELYLKKTFWVWTEGTYQSEYYGLGGYNSGGYLYESAANRFLQDGSQYRDVFRWIVYVFNFLMYCLIVLMLTVSIKKRDYKEELFVLIILGFIAFYIIWEIKSRYLYPCYPYLLILAYTGMRRIISGRGVIMNIFTSTTNK